MTKLTDKHFDVLIIGGGAAGISCALTLGSGLSKPFALGKKIGMLAHQKASSMQRAVFNNVFGIAPGTLGSDLLISSIDHLKQWYPDVEIMENTRALSIQKNEHLFIITTAYGMLTAQNVVVAIGSGQPMLIEGLEKYVEPNGKAHPDKQRIQLRNTDHLVDEGLYVAGTLAGSRSQLAIAMGSGAAVATDILTLWNEGIPVQVHDALPKG
ncbi:MAG: pyridine nucleotide-disulfide oxidoreductase [Flavobacterium sp. BFFFF2]|nr:MAG: pyridine nucleotide-disulfide oxidoreductase [Flavobacterium sp. BFFFF2]